MAGPSVIAGLFAVPWTAVGGLMLLPSGDGLALAWRLVAAVMLVAAAGRFLLLGVWLGSGQIRVMSWFRTRRYPAGSFRRVRVGRYSGWANRFSRSATLAMGVLELEGGEQCPAPMWVWWAPSAAAWAGRLQDRIASMITG